MKSRLMALATFMIPFGVYGDHVGRSVAKHLSRDNFSGSDIELGYFSFFVFAGLMAGLVCLAIKKILAFDARIRYLSLGAVLFPLLWGYLLADATLGEYYDRPGMCGGVMDWLAGTAVAFSGWGLLPALMIFCLVVWRNRTIEPAHE